MRPSPARRGSAMTLDDHDVQLIVPARAAGPRRGALLAALLLAPGATLLAQDGGGAPADPAAGAAAAPAGPTEKDLLADFGKAFKSRKPAERAAAITALGDASRTLPDKGASKPMAKALSDGL